MSLEALECPICIERFETDLDGVQRVPFVFPCGHGCCNECLERLPLEFRVNRCPECRAPFVQKDSSSCPAYDTAVICWEQFLFVRYITDAGLHHSEKLPRKEIKFCAGCEKKEDPSWMHILKDGSGILCSECIMEKKIPGEDLQRRQLASHDFRAVFPPLPRQKKLVELRETENPPLFNGFKSAIGTVTKGFTVLQVQESQEKGWNPTQCRQCNCCYTEKGHDPINRNCGHIICKSCFEKPVRNVSGKKLDAACELCGSVWRPKLDQKPVYQYKSLVAFFIDGGFADAIVEPKAHKIVCTTCQRTKPIEPTDQSPTYSCVTCKEEDVCAGCIIDNHMEHFVLTQQDYKLKVSKVKESSQELWNDIENVAKALLYATKVIGASEQLFLDNVALAKPETLEKRLLEIEETELAAPEGDETVKDMKLKFQNGLHKVKLIIQMELDLIEIKNKFSADIMSGKYDNYHLNDVSVYNLSRPAKKKAAEEKSQKSITESGSAPKKSGKMEWRASRNRKNRC